MPDETIFSFKSFWTAVQAYHWWQIAIELFLIGAVVFWVIRFLRGTRGARMLKGVAFVLISLYLIVRLVGNQFGLNRIEFLYGRFLIFAGLATDHATDAAVPNNRFAGSSSPVIFPIKPLRLTPTTIGRPRAFATSP